ncbi:MAG: glycosyltransferase family 2 protein [Rikenellaceae bacterium]
MQVECSPYISVIVPIYNVELYVERCLESLFNQTRTDNIEYILIDDKTPDKSMVIADRVVDRYSHLNVRTIRLEENTGISMVRQRGVDEAKGRYILFVDSDDWCDGNMLEELSRVVEQRDADIVVCDYYVASYNLAVQCDVYTKHYVPSSGVDCVLSLFRGESDGFLWNKLIKKSLFEIGDIKFPKGVDVWEDTAVICQLYLNASDIVYLPRAFLHYRRKDKDTVSTDVKKKSDLVDVRIESFMIYITIFEEYLRQRNLYEVFQEEIIYLKLSVKYIVYLHPTKLYREQSLKMFEDTNRHILKHPRLSVKSKLLYYLAINRCDFVVDLFVGSYNWIKNR